MGGFSRLYKRRLAEGEMGWTVGLLIRGYIDEGGPYGMGLTAGLSHPKSAVFGCGPANHGLENFGDSL
jgi:hypothetical protein